MPTLIMIAWTKISIFAVGICLLLGLQVVYKQRFPKTFWLRITGVTAIILVLTGVDILAWYQRGYLLPHQIKVLKNAIEIIVLIAFMWSIIKALQQEKRS